jgi:hypothetical protein
MQQLTTITSYRKLAEAVIYKALVDANAPKQKDDVMAFLGSKEYDLYCQICGADKDRVRRLVVRPRNQALPVDIYCDGKRIIRAPSITAACRMTHDSINAIRSAMQTHKTSRRGYMYRACVNKSVVVS